MAFEAVFRNVVRLYIVLITSNKELKSENFVFRMYIPVYDKGGYIYNIDTGKEIVNYHRVTMIN